MRSLAIFLILSATLAAAAQSRRVVPGATPTTPAAAAAGDLTVKQMFDEVNGYLRAKVAEFDAKKIPYSDDLLNRSKLEQRQLAAKYAAITATRKELTTEDQYYFGMLHWIAENFDGALAALGRFVSAGDADKTKVQTARSVMVVMLAKQKKLDEAESLLAVYLAGQPTKLTERSRIGGEMAKAYQSAKDYKKMAPHAESCYVAVKALLQDATSRARGLDEILDAAMLVFEAYRDGGEQKKAEDALDEMRATAVEVESPSFYYYAVDQKIRYLIDTGRKPAAQALYTASVEAAGKDFASKTAAADAQLRLKKRERHYRLLGDAAPEIALADQWFPGTARPLSAYRGKVVLLDFWATWCMPCIEAFPSLIEWHTDFQRDGLEILGITRYYGTVNGLPADEQNETAYLKRFRQSQRLPYDFVVMKDQSAQTLYGATLLPTAVLIDRKGVVRYIETGTSPARLVQMREMVLKLLAEK